LIFIVFSDLADIYDHVEDELKSYRFELDCIGGGRILHEPEKRSLFVYGYSQVDLYLALNLKTRYSLIHLHLINRALGVLIIKFQ
jgi:hypothetical protein